MRAVSQFGGVGTQSEGSSGSGAPVKEMVGSRLVCVQLHFTQNLVAGIWGLKLVWNYQLFKRAWQEEKLDVGNFKQNQAATPSTPSPAPVERLLFLCLPCVSVLILNKQHLMFAEYFEDERCFLKCLSAMIITESTELCSQAGKRQFSKN